MKMHDVFPSRFLKADDLEDGDLTVTIHDSDPVTHEEFPQKGKPTPESKPILHFSQPRGTKSLVLNKTNWTAISKALGSDDSDDWCGRQITLYATEVESFGEMTMAIRVRLKSPAKAMQNGSAPAGDGDGATKFWSTANGLGISREEATPIAKKAIAGELTWAQAIAQIDIEAGPTF